SGHYHNHAHFDCLNLSISRNWNYIIYMQNFDIILRTNRELADILTAMNGANDVSIEICVDNYWDNRCRIREKNLGKFGLCPLHLSKSDYGKCAGKSVQLAKGSTQVTLSRQT
ncbi:hypothetical protein PFISCL1PPCAC_13172, partial [Pristionchus fissidentatus]